MSRDEVDIFPLLDFFTQSINAIPPCYKKKKKPKPQRFIQSKTNYLLSPSLPLKWPL
jgi:hypothetical protein